MAAEPDQNLPPLVGIGGRYLAFRPDSAKFAVYERCHLVFVKARGCLAEKFHYMSVRTRAKLKKYIAPLFGNPAGSRQDDLIFCAGVFMVYDKKNAVERNMVKLAVFLYQ
jgi:hypothetical protein